MKTLKTCLWLAIGCLFFSCKKETVNASLKSSDQNGALSVTEEAKWQGKFLSLNALPASRYVPDRSFIGNGYARIFSDSVKIDEHNYYSTAIRLLIPASENIKGDSLNFEAGLRNSFNSSFYHPSHG